MVHRSITISLNLPPKGVVVCVAKWRSLSITKYKPHLVIIVILRRDVDSLLSVFTDFLDGRLIHYVAFLASSEVVYHGLHIISSV